MSRDCLNEIFDYLEQDEPGLRSLRSCLLVNRLWCEVSVPILWKSIRNYDTVASSEVFKFIKRRKEVSRRFLY